MRRMVTQRQEKLLLAVLTVGVLTLTGGLVLFHRPAQAKPEKRNTLSEMRLCRLRVGRADMHLWVAGTPLQRELGLMWVRSEELPADHGMIFVFHEDQFGGFWMKNTLLPLDIAFIRHDGTVVDIKQMEPLSLVSHSPREAYRYAIEAKAGTWAAANLHVGDIVNIPAELLE